LFSAVPASAATELGWNEFKLPSNATTSNVVLPTTDPPVDFAVANDGTTIYAVDGANQWVYKSTDAGLTWSRKAPTNMPAAPDFVAVAPDDPDLVAVVDGGACYASTDGLSKLSDLGTTGVTTILDVAISPESSGKHHIVVAGTDGANEQIGSYDLGATVPSWTDLDGKTGLDATDRILAVAFSPGFASDFTLAAVTETAATAIYLELYSYATGNDNWNDDAGTWSDYDATNNIICVPGGAAVAADISLAPDYYGGDEAMRISFVGLDVVTAANDGVYRMTDESAKGIKTNVDIHSVAYDGTNLVAGESVGNSVYRSSDPLASSPSFSTASTYQKPGGTQDVLLRWSGADVFGISGGAEGGFSVSHDNGKSFNDISLINTTLTDLQDIAVSADGSVVWAITDDGGTDISVWRKASDWERVLQYTPAAAANYIVRLAPNDTDDVYLGVSGGTTMFYSSDGGEAKWHLRNCGVTLVDLAVEDADVVYAINTGGSVSKSTNNGFTWGSSKSTGIGAGSTITSMGEDKLLATGTGADKVAWSTDGNSSWSKTSKAVTGAGPVQAVATGLSDGDFIYASTAPAAGTAATVERWEIGTSTSWWNMSAPTVRDLDGDATDEDYGAYGIGLANGTLYVLLKDNNPTVNSALIRTLGPSASTVSWSTVAATAKDHDGAPASTNGANALKLSAGSTNAWAIDSANEKFYYYIDTVSSAGPTLAGPGDGAEVLVNPVSGGTYTISFTWERLSKATKYNLDIALDSGFNEKVLSYTGGSGNTTPAKASTSSTVAQVVGGGTFMPETTYYWRVRLASDGPVYSPWSEVRSFTIAALPEAEPPVVVQAPPPAPIIEVPEAPAITLEPPEIVLPAPPPAPPEIVIPAAPPPAAPAIPAWAIYAIIIIGAVLVIALIVLIMRTRRPV
jgi:hypothetical protein